VDDVIGFCFALVNTLLWMLIKLRRNTNKGLSYTVGTTEAID